MALVPACTKPFRSDFLCNGDLGASLHRLSRDTKVRRALFFARATAAPGTNAAKVESEQKRSRVGMIEFQSSGGTRGPQTSGNRRTKKSSFSQKASNEDAHKRDRKGQGNSVAKTWQRNKSGIAVASSSSRPATSTPPSLVPGFSSSSGLKEPLVDESGKLRTKRSARELALSLLFVSLSSPSLPLSTVLQQRMSATVPQDTLVLLCKLYGLQPPPASAEGSGRIEGGGGGAVGESNGAAGALKEDLAVSTREKEEEQETALSLLSSPLPTRYSMDALDFSLRLLEVCSSEWKEHGREIEAMVPELWKKRQSDYAIPLGCLRLAMAELNGSFPTPKKVVINEVVDLTKLFCSVRNGGREGSAGRVVHGCIARHIRNMEEGSGKAVKAAETQRVEGQDPDAVGPIPEESLEAMGHLDISFDDIDPESLGWDEASSL